MITRHRSLPPYLSCSTAITDCVNAKQPTIRVVEIQGSHLKNYDASHVHTIRTINQFNVLQMERPQLQQQPYQAYGWIQGRAINLNDYRVTYFKNSVP